MQSTVLEVKDLSKVFYSNKWIFFRDRKSAFTAVDKISFKLNKGEILGILGPNGSGKTTTIQMLLSTLTPTFGNILYFGKNFFQNRSESLQNIAFASTYLSLPGKLSILENLYVYGKLYNIPMQPLNQRIEEFLKFFGMWEMRHKNISTLSAGQITRVMIVKAFLGKPSIVLLDEPTASLDPEIALEVRKFLLKQRDAYGVSILLASHNMDEVAQVCDRILVLKNGKIIASDTPKSLAASISKTRLHLMLSDLSDKTKLVELANQQNLAIKYEMHSFEIFIDEHQISNFLILMAKQDIQYSQISIETPTLEDYFLSIVNQNSSTK